MEWRIQDAKNRLSELVNRPRSEGLQVVTSRGKRAVEILSAEIYDSRLASRPTIVDRLLSGAVWDDDLLRPSMPAKGAKPPGRGLKRTG